MLSGHSLGFAYYIAPQGRGEMPYGILYTIHKSMLFHELNRLESSC